MIKPNNNIYIDDLKHDYSKIDTLSDILITTSYKKFDNGKKIYMIGNLFFIANQNIFNISLNYPVNFNKINSINDEEELNLKIQKLIKSLTNVPEYNDKLTKFYKDNYSLNSNENEISLKLRDSLLKLHYDNFVKINL